MTVDIDDARTDRPRAQREPEKAFGRSQIPVWRQQEIDGVAA